MAPKTANKTSNGGEEKKVKVPKSFIVRPGPDSTKGCRKVYVDKAILAALELTNGAFVNINAIESGKVLVATVHHDVTLEVPEQNVVLLSLLLRRLGGILLGDRVILKKSTRQPSYADQVTVSLLNKKLEDKGSAGITTSDDIVSESLKESKPESEFKEPKLDKLFDSVGVLSPGLIVDNIVQIVSVSSSIEGKLASLTISGTSETEDSLIFRKGSTQITVLDDDNGTFSSDWFSQVGGLEKEIEVLKSVVELPLNNPTLFSDFGISPPRGILLHGPPGTGKTMLLRCVAQSSGNAHILSVNGPSIVSKYLGETEEAIRDIFQEAKKYQPSLIFMDEIDSLAPNRNSDDSGEAESRVVATLLTMMDGLGADVNSQIVVVGATNRPNSIDPALRRPGRFDQEIEIGIPDVDSRLDILTRQFSRMKKLKVSAEDLNGIASKTHGYVGADLTALCRESVMKAIKRGMSNNTPQADIFISIADVEHALLEITPLAMREIFLEMPKVYWTDIGGQHELKRKLIEVVQLPLEAAETFVDLGVLAPKGVLLYGPPGCSKTLTAKALATESGLNFLAVKGPEIFNKYIGESERAIREIFRKARAASPSIIFFDEVDAISGDRDDAGTLALLHVLTSLLNEIDGVEELNGVVIVAATNRPTEIDPALLRPGRLDRHIYVAPPDYEARLQILHNKTKKFGTPVDLQEIAKATEGCLGAEVALLCQEAGLAAVMEDKKAKIVEQRHFEHALAGISRGITPEMLKYYQEFAAKSGIDLKKE